MLSFLELSLFFSESPVGLVIFLMSGSHHKGYKDLAEKWMVTGISLHLNHLSRQSHWQKTVDLSELAQEGSGPARMPPA